MNVLKSPFSTIQKLTLLLGIAIAFSVLLLAIRIKLNGSFRFLFLIWNLFLAGIPFAISYLLSTTQKISKFSFLGWFAVWLLFLPNAPYIITDLIHLKWSAGVFMWLDILLVTSFAVNGLILFYLSISDMKSMMHRYLSPRVTSIALILVFGLTAFGIYLGRFLRFNSWDILQQPGHLFNDILEIVIQPKVHFEAWLFTLTFGLFLYIVYQFFKSTSTINL